MIRRNRERGATLVEVLVAIALTGIMLPAFAEAALVSRADQPMAAQRLEAESLEREALEAVRVVREAGWSSVSTDGTYHPVISGSTWSLAAGSEVIGNMTRQIAIASVERDSSGAIVSSSGTTDPNTKLVTATVAWTEPANGSVSEQTYLTRWQNNLAWVQTSQADFSGGTLANTTATGSGTVQLSDSPATWQLPSTVGGYNVTGSGSALAVAYTVIASVPYALVGYAGGMAIVDVSNPASPTLAGTFTTSAAVNGIFVQGTTAYLATAITTAQFKIVDLSSPSSPTEIGTLGVGNSAATAVAISGNYAYLAKSAETGSNSEFNVIDISNPAVPSVVGSLARQGATFNAVAISGNYAYLATDQTSAQFRVIDITNKSAPSSAATVDLSVTANDVAISGTTAFVATNNNPSSGELQIYDVSSPTAPTPLGSYEVGADVNGVELDPSNAGYVLLATAASGKQAIAVDVSSPASPAPVSSVNYGATTNKVVVSGTYAYYGTTNTSQELMIVYAGYRPSGTFESSTFDAGSSVAFNGISFTASVPGGSTLKFQVAADNTGSGWSYVGPDGTSGTFYTADGMIPLTVSNNRYFRYRAVFAPTSDGQVSPVLSDVTINYSP